MRALKKWWKKPGHPPMLAGTLVESLETRQLLSAGVNYLAPATLAGGTLTASIATATAPLATTGSYALAPDHSGSVAVTTTTGTALTDTYAYSRTGLNSGVLRYLDASSGITYVDTLTFANGTAGTFSIAAADSASGGTQSGSFTFAPAPQPLGPDLIANFLKVPSGVSVLAGQSTDVVLNIANVGSTGGAGFVTVNFYLSANGLPANATPLGATGTLTALGLQFSTNLGRRVTFPNTVASGSYFLVATLTPAANFTDVDHSNDIAVSAAPIHITSTGAGGGSGAMTVTLTSSIVNIFPTALQGGKLALIFVQLASNMNFEGNVPINLLAVGGQSGAPPTVLAAVAKKIAFRAGQSGAFPIRLLVPRSLTTGSYALEAQLGPSTTRVGPTQQIVPTASSPLSAPVMVNIVQPPVATLTAAVTSLPAVVGPGQPLAVSILLTNTGTAGARGLYRLQLFAAPIGNPNAIRNIPLLAIPQRPLLLQPGQQYTLTVNIHVPRNLTVLAPSYSVVVVLDASAIADVSNPNSTIDSTDLFSVM